MEGTFVLIVLFAWSCHVGISSGSSSDNCGIENSKANGKRIIGGSETAANQYPWMVRLPMGCGGSLITDRHILTARHCLCWRGHHSNNHDDCIKKNICHCRTMTSYQWVPTLKEGTDYWRGQMVKVGVHNQDDATDYQEIPIKEVKWPKGDDHDFAMITLDRAVDLTDNTIGTVCLPNGANEDFKGEKVVAMGWGDTIDTGLGRSPVLNYVWLTVSQGQYGPNYLNTDIGNVNNVHESTCNGDSGGPLVYKNVRTGRWTIIGTLYGAQGKDCLTATANIWNKITAHYDWIKDTAHTCPSSDSQYMPHATDCQKFYHCSPGHAPVEKTCPANLLWSITINRCDYAQNVPCPRRPSASTCPYTDTFPVFCPKWKDAKDADCTGKNAWIANYCQKTCKC